MFKLLGFSLGGIVTLTALYIVAVKPTPDEIKKIAEDSGVINTIEDVGQSALSMSNEFMQESKALLEEFNKTDQDMDSPISKQPDESDLVQSINIESDVEQSSEALSFAAEQQNEKSNTEQFSESRWETFWTFNYEYSADQFSQHLAKLTGLELDVFPSKETNFDVAYKYTSEADRQQAIQLIEAHGSIKLASKLPLSVAIND